MGASDDPESISLDTAVMLGELVQLHPPPASPGWEVSKQQPCPGEPETRAEERLLQAASSPAASSQGGSGRSLTSPQACLEEKGSPTCWQSIDGCGAPAPCRDHALHPLGFSRMVEAQEGRLAQADGATCGERGCQLPWGGRRAPPQGGQQQGDSRLGILG